jgi:protein-S-isoprenylcysteine O-methyltransferase Ste14
VIASRRTAPLVKTLVFTVIVPGTVTVLIPRWLLAAGPEGHRAALGALHYLGLLPILLGAAGYLRCAWDFATAGRGTPAPLDPPKALVVRGLYRVVRNPMYVAVLLVLFGEALLFGSPRLLGYAVVVLVLFHLFVVAYEEPTLRRAFGPSYDEYRAAVPRWLPRRGPAARHGGRGASPTHGGSA